VKKHANVPIDEAKAMGAMAIFGEKYGANVRVVEVAEGESTELCGGIHVDNTRDIHTFRIVSESAIAAGVRRIECVTCKCACKLFNEERALLNEIAKTLHCDASAIIARIEKLQQANSRLEKEVEQANLRIAQAELAGILATRKDSANGVAVYAATLKVRDRKDLLTYGDLLRDRMDVGVAMIGAIIDGKPALTCVASDKAVKAGIHAGKLVGACAAIVGGKGGGRPNAAQAGGTDADKLDEAIQHIYTLV
jgi:alanyl-tRNA synthetase